MNRFHAAAAFAALAAASAVAQSNLVGKYTGSYTLQTRTGDTQVGVKLDLKEVEGNKVKGTAELNGSGGCDGAYPMEGKLTKTSLSLKSTEKSGRAKDCSFGVNLKPEGEKLVGKTAGGRALTLTR